MNSDNIKKQALNFNRSRNNLLAVIAFTLINLILLALDLDLQFLFSAFVPYMLFWLFYDISMTIGLGIAVAALSVYLLCYFLSKRYRVFIFIALILFLLDFLLLIGMMLLLGSFAEFIFDLLFHTWISFYLITGTIAWIKLRNTTPEQVEAIRLEAERAEQGTELDSALDVLARPDETDENDTQEPKDDNNY